MYTTLSGYEFVFDEVNTIHIVSFRGAAILPPIFFVYALCYNTTKEGGFDVGLLKRLELLGRDSETAPLMEAATILRKIRAHLRAENKQPYIGFERILPPPPDGPLRLGSFVKDLRTLEIPLVMVDPEKIYTDVKETMISASYPRLPGAQSLAIRQIEIIFFQPTIEYVQMSVQSPEISDIFKSQSGFDAGASPNLEPGPGNFVITPLTQTIVE